MNPLQISELLAREVSEAVPALVERTRAQVELTQRLVGQLPCLSNLWGQQSSPAGDRSARTPEDSDGDDREGADGADHPEPAPTAVPADVNDQLPTVDVQDLAIPDYDSLAASQVVPRLASLDPAELALVLTYEQSHRSRQTILNRVRQLQAATNGS